MGSPATGNVTATSHDRNAREAAVGQVVFQRRPHAGEGQGILFVRFLTNRRVSPTRARAKVDTKNSQLGKIRRTHAGEGRRVLCHLAGQRVPCDPPHRHTLFRYPRVLLAVASTAHSWEHICNAVSFSEISRPSCDALPQLPDQRPPPHRIPSPPLHDSASPRSPSREPCDVSALGA